MANTQMSLSHSRYLQCYLKIPTSMLLCGLGMQQYAMHNATIQKTTFFELGVYVLTFFNNAGFRLTLDNLSHVRGCTFTFSSLIAFTSELNVDEISKGYREIVMGALSS